MSDEWLPADKLGVERRVGPNDTFFCEQCKTDSGPGDSAWTCEHCEGGPFTEGCLDDHMDTCPKAQEYERNARERFPPLDSYTPEQIAIATPHVRKARRALRKPR